MANPSKRYPWQVEMLSPTNSGAWYCLAAYSDKDEADDHAKRAKRRAPQVCLRVTKFAAPKTRS